MGPPSTSELKLLCLSDFGSEWTWFRHLYDRPAAIDWRFFSTLRGPLLARLPGPHLGRVRGALALARALRLGGGDVLASVGPRNDHYAAVAARGTGVPHFASCFNFTDLPTGYRLDAMRRSFARIDRFAVFSRLERQLYADLFDVPVDRFHFCHWGVAPPIEAPLPPAIPGRYVVAIGGEARDYATLCAAARRLPATPFVVVARPDSLAGIDVPGNVTVLVNRPWLETWSLVAHAAAAVVPLRSGATPNGHVTIVGTMHMGKALVATDSIGIHDYLEHGSTALLVPPRDDAAFAAAIERLLDEPALGHRLGAAAKAFAGIHCTERASADFAAAQILELAGRTDPATGDPAKPRAALD